MKHAFVDITLDALADLLHLPIGTLKGITPSPLGDDYARLGLSGDALPAPFSDQPRRAKLYYDGSLTCLNLSIVPAD